MVKWTGGANGTLGDASGVVETGGRLVKHARDYWFLLAESHLTRRLFGAMVQRMTAVTIRAGYSHRLWR